MTQRKIFHGPEREQDGPGQFDRFEQLTRRLLAVPKQEAKEAERKARQRKARENGR